LGACAQDVVASHVASVDVGGDKRRASERPRGGETHLARGAALGDARRAERARGGEGNAGGHRRARK
jgi:hypothetical protein